MYHFEIKQLSELNDKQKEEAVVLFVEGFNYLFKFTDDVKKLEKLFRSSLDFSMTYVCLVEDAVGGILGLGTNKKRPFYFEACLCTELFGNFKGNIICNQLNAIFSTPAVKGEKDLYIDFLTTAKSLRGKGIGTMLLEFALLLPEFETASIEVLSKNSIAKRLYEKIGFVTDKKSYNLFMIMQGFGYPIKMIKNMK